MHVKQSPIHYSNWILFFVGYICFLSPLQSQNEIQNLKDKFKEVGFENIRIMNQNDTLVFCFEDRTYQWKVNGLLKAMELSTSIYPDAKGIQFFLLDRDIPKLSIGLQKKNSKWISKVSNSIDNSWHKLKKEKPQNKSQWKFDFIPYTQFALRNTSFHKIYRVQLNFAPAVEVSPWKGMRFVGQYIFPIYNDLGYWGKWVRPGIIMVQQEFKPFDRWYVNLSWGNYSNYRYGAVMGIRHYFLNNAFAANLQLAYTGKSYYHNNKWFIKEINQLSYRASLEYFLPYYGLHIELGYEKYIADDQGLRFDLSRFFKNTCVGFYATLIEKEISGGFHFAIPILPKKRSKPRRLRVRLPYYFDWEYYSRTNTNRGQYFEIQPDENRIENYYDSKYIETQLKINRDEK
ncbi:MAG: hypothetical protein ACEPOW_10315 [Bacteroidales bacterium]